MLAATLSRYSVIPFNTTWTLIGPCDLHSASALCVKGDFQYNGPQNLGEKLWETPHSRRYLALIGSHIVIA